jgi:hypothetical protein
MVYCLSFSVIVGACTQGLQERRSNMSFDVALILSLAIMGAMAFYDLKIKKDK